MAAIECLRYSCGIGFAQFDGLLQRHAVRDVTADGIVGAGLVGKNIGNNAALGEFRNQVSTISDEADGSGFAFSHGVFQNAQGFVEGGDHHVAIAGLDAALDALRVHIDAEECCTVHGRSERLGSPHAAHATSDDKFAGKSAAKVLLRSGGESFIGALQNSLGADVNPTARGHLSIHHQTGAIKLIELFPVVPVADKVGIAEENARCVLVRTKNGDRFAGLYQEGLITFQGAEGFDDSVEAIPVAGGLSCAAIDDQVLRLFGHIGI